MNEEKPPLEKDAIWGDELIAELERVGESVELAKNEDLFRQGDASDAMYVLVEGSLLVLDQRGDGEDHLLRQIAAGSYVGETALVRGGQRTATVRSRERCRLVRVSRDDVRELEGRHAGLRRFLAEIVRRRMPSLRMATSRIFDGLAPELLAELEECFEWLNVPGGTQLIRKGDAPDALYVVMHGRLRVMLEKNGIRSVDLGPGEVVGEMALVTGQERSADVWALRDSELLKLSREDFDRILAHHPAMYRPLIRSVVQRLREDNVGDSSMGTRDRSLVLLPVGRRPERDLVRELATALGRYGSVLHLDRERFDHLHGAGAAQIRRGERRFIYLAEWLNRQEDEYDFVLYEADLGASEWTSRCLRQADHLLLAARANAFDELGPNAELLEKERQPGASRVRSLLLLHPAREVEPNNTEAWLDRLRPDRHHHLAIDEPETIERLGRILAARSVGVVLGGGGARGFAHIGVLRALRERDIPIDHVGGTSTGAVIGSLCAGGSSIEEIIELNEAAFVGSGMHRALTVPIVSILSGQIPARHLDNRFADGRIEDLWLDFFCVSTNLTRAEERVHRRGRIADAVLASVAMPALFPPLFDDGDVLVDGGVANNLPIDLMKDICQGPIIASDVSPELSLEADREMVRCPSVSRVLGDRLLRRHRWKELPRLGEIVRRTIEYSSVVHKNEQRRLATLYLTPPVEEITLLEGVRIREIEALGYEYAISEIDAFLEGVGPAGMSGSRIAPHPRAER